jgi:hypothetical protein
MPENPYFSFAIKRIGESIFGRQNTQEDQKLTQPEIDSVVSGINSQEDTPSNPGQEIQNKRELLLGLKDFLLVTSERYFPQEENKIILEDKDIFYANLLSNFSNINELRDFVTYLKEEKKRKLQSNESRIEEERYGPFLRRIEEEQKNLVLEFIKLTQELASVQSFRSKFEHTETNSTNLSGDQDFLQRFQASGLRTLDNQIEELKRKIAELGRNPEPATPPAPVVENQPIQSEVQTPTSNLTAGEQEARVETPAEVGQLSESEINSRLTSLYFKLNNLNQNLFNLQRDLKIAQNALPYVPSEDIRDLEIQKIIEIKNKIEKLKIEIYPVEKEIDELKSLLPSVEPSAEVPDREATQRRVVSAQEVSRVIERSRATDWKERFKKFLKRLSAKVGAGALSAFRAYNSAFSPQSVNAQGSSDYQERYSLSEENPEPTEEPRIIVPTATPTSSPIPTAIPTITPSIDPTAQSITTPTEAPTREQPSPTSAPTVNRTETPRTNNQGATIESSTPSQSTPKAETSNVTTPPINLNIANIDPKEAQKILNEGTQSEVTQRFEGRIGPTVFTKDSKIYYGVNYKEGNKLFTSDDLKNFRALVERDDGTSFIITASLVDGKVAFDLTGVNLDNILYINYLIGQNAQEQSGKEDWKIAGMNSGAYVKQEIDRLSIRSDNIESMTETPNPSDQRSTT